METKVKPKHCPGSDRAITQDELLQKKKVKDKWGYPVTRYRCNDCGKYYTRRWDNNHFTRHGFKLDEEEKKYREAKKLEKEQAEAEKKRLKAEKEEQKRLAKLLAEGKVCFCAECDSAIFDITDYLCGECRANL